MMIQLLLFLSTAQAALPPVKCTSFEELNAKVDSCEGNRAYSEAALSCKKQFEKLVSDQTAQAAAKLGTASSAGQANQMKNAMADYSLSQAVLAELIEAGKKTKSDVDAYLDNIVFPEDYDAPEEVIGDQTEFLDGSACYAESRDNLENLLDSIDDQLEDLEKARSASLARQNLSGERQEGLSNSLVKGAAKTNAKAAAPSPAGKATNGASDITGVKPKNK